MKKMLMFFVVAIIGVLAACGSQSVTAPPPPPVHDTSHTFFSMTDHWTSVTDPVVCFDTLTPVFTDTTPPASVRQYLSSIGVRWMQTCRDSATNNVVLSGVIGQATLSYGTLSDTIVAFKLLNDGARPRFYVGMIDTAHTRIALQDSILSVFVHQHVSCNDTVTTSTTVDAAKWWIWHIKINNDTTDVKGSNDYWFNGTSLTNGDSIFVDSTKTYTVTDSVRNLDGSWADTSLTISPADLPFHEPTTWVLNHLQIIATSQGLRCN